MERRSPTFPLERHRGHYPKKNRVAQPVFGPGKFDRLLGEPESSEVLHVASPAILTSAPKRYCPGRGHLRKPLPRHIRRRDFGFADRLVPCKTQPVPG